MKLTRGGRWQAGLRMSLRSWQRELQGRSDLLLLVASSMRLGGGG